MSTLEEICNELMKSARELADWEYPLSQILEKYYSLLESPTDINYGEAALIIQNSVDVYTRRVDYLDKEVFVLNQSFIEHEAQEEKAKTKNKERKSRRTIIDFDNFEPLDFGREIGKNINLRNQTQKPVKLLNRRFTQLETSAAQMRFPIEVSDIHGEAIGKKYDFRCNQQLTITGMLVDECMPSDFDPPNLCNEQRTSHVSLTTEASKSSTLYPDSLLDNITVSRVSPEREEFSLNSSNDTIENCDAQEDLGYFTLSSVSQNTSEINGTFNSSVSSLVSDSGLGTAVIDNSCVDEPDHFDEDSDHEAENHEESTSTNNPVVLMNGEKENEKVGEQLEVLPSSTERSENGDAQSVVNGASNNVQLEINEVDEEDENSTGNYKETDSGYRSGGSEDFEIPKKRSRKMKNMVCVNDIDKNIWKPIPFDQGIPDKLHKSRNKFKLPCHISLLKSKNQSRKRKILSVERMSESLPKFFLNESESPMKKVGIYSPSRPFMPLKTEDLNDFLKTFDDCFKSKQRYDVYHYEAATTVTMDLLGFFPSFTKHDPLSSSLPVKRFVSTPEHMSPHCSDMSRPVTPEVTIYDANTPPDSPMMDNTFEADDPPLHSTLNYQQVIECRMRKILEEFDVRTDLEQNVARWHETIKPKLHEAEKRPPFHIHEYGNHIVQKLKNTTEHRIDFDDVVAEQPSAEVARYFLASLQLANSYNVDIRTNAESNNIELFLLDSENARPKVPYETPKSSKVNTKKFRHFT